MMFICIKQHLSNTWSSINEKVKRRWDWIEKNVAYKKACSVPFLFPLKTEILWISGVSKG